MFGGFVRNFGWVFAILFWGPFNYKSRGDPSLYWLGGGVKNCEQKFCEQTDVSNFSHFWVSLRKEEKVSFWSLLGQINDFFFLSLWLLSVSTFARNLSELPKGPFRTKNSTALESVVFCYRRSFSLSVPFSCLLSLQKQALLSTLRSVLLLP